MGGGLIQLAAYGAQDLYLTGNPQITFFKVLYKRHTNFAIESIQQTFNGKPEPGSKLTATISRNGDLIHKMWLTATIPDISITFDNQLNGITSTTATLHLARKFGYVLLKSCELMIGGQQIDKHYGDWMNIWNELTLQESKKDGFSQLIGDGEGTTNPKFKPYSYSGFSFSYNEIQNSESSLSDKMSQNPTDYDKKGFIPSHEINIPLEFWFCRNPGLALPLIALQYHDIRINIELNEAKYYGMMSLVSTYSPGGLDNKAIFTIGTNTANTITTKKPLSNTVNVARKLLSEFQFSSIYLWVDYIYLDIDERRRFSQTSHEYLIEQLQYTGEEAITPVANTPYGINLHFNHTIKELFWVIQPNTNLTEKELQATDGDAVFDDAETNASHCYLDYQFYTDAGQYISETTQAALLTANIQQYPVNPVISAYLEMNGQERFKERTGEYFNLVQPYQNHTRIPSDKGINVYSFALRPEEHQPSGVCNLSRIDDVKLYLTLRSSIVHKARVYALGYNVLRILSGMAGLAFAI